MYSGIGEKSSLNLDNTSDQSKNCQTNEYAGYFYWAGYFHHLNNQAMMNLPIQVLPLNLTENNLNSSYPLTQLSHYSPISSSSSSSSSNMKDLCSYNPSNMFKNGKNPQTDNNILKCRPNCLEWNLKDNIKYIANAVPSNQFPISGNLYGDYPQKLAVYNHEVNEHNKEMDAVKKEIPGDFELSKAGKSHASHQIHPINQPQLMSKNSTKEYVVVDETQMDEIIAKELDLALMLSKKGHRNSRSYRFNQQVKQKTRPRTGKKFSIKNRLISVTVERIKAAVFNRNSNPSSFQINNTSDHEAKQQSKQNQSFLQPEFWNQYQANNSPQQFQYPQIMCKPNVGVMRQPADLQSIGRKTRRYCTCKNSDVLINNGTTS